MSKLLLPTLKCSHLDSQILIFILCISRNFGLQLQLQLTKVSLKMDEASEISSVPAAKHNRILL